MVDQVEARDPGGSDARTNAHEQGESALAVARRAVALQVPDTRRFASAATNALEYARAYCVDFLAWWRSTCTHAARTKRSGRSKLMLSGVTSSLTGSEMLVENQRRTHAADTRPQGGPRDHGEVRTPGAALCARGL